jgi:hypothetical protein
MYSSTTDALNALYDKLSVGGFLIVDDYALPTCRHAIEDFSKVRNIHEEIHQIDWTGIWWRKSKP